ncbi:MAG TPA: Holliday junction branch migration DNA helicase RuvB [Terriglobia bacterium]|nr:Holliday junction branch migration DNA helicase RuvB [Terriglobia bacterium]HUZ46211.1 Holliday junction branch migration DNA helicase RuvB [Terriglobia bacterium]
MSWFRKSATATRAEVQVALVPEVLSTPVPEALSAVVPVPEAQVVPVNAPQIVAPDLSLRPQSLQEYVGQEHIIARLKVALHAARARNAALPHVLFHGAPGLGKTSISGVLAKEIGGSMIVTSGPVLEKSGDIVSPLLELKPRDVLFIDEIHRIPAKLAEVLYGAMEDFTVDMALEFGTESEVMHFRLPPFTLAGATTRAGDLAAPLRMRFGLICNMEFYRLEELKRIITRSAAILGIGLRSGAAEAIAQRARETPRVANNLLLRMRDYAAMEGLTRVTAELIERSMEAEGIDTQGLEPIDRRYMGELCGTYKGGPVGLVTLAASLQETEKTLTELVEPYLMRAGLLSRTGKGRVATEKAKSQFGGS